MIVKRLHLWQRHEKDMSNFSAPFNVMVQNQCSHNILLLLVGQAVYCSRVPYASFLLKWTNRFPVFCSCKALFLLSFLLVSFLPDSRLTGPCADWLIQYLRWLRCNWMLAFYQCVFCWGWLTVKVYGPPAGLLCYKVRDMAQYTMYMPW